MMQRRATALVFALAASVFVAFGACVYERRCEDADVCAASVGFDLALQAAQRHGMRGKTRQYLAVNPALNRSVRGSDGMLQKPLEPPADFVNRLRKVRAGVEPVSALSSSVEGSQTVVVVVGDTAVKPGGIASICILWHAAGAGIWAGEFVLSSTPRGWKVERVVEWGTAPPPLSYRSNRPEGR